MKNTLVKYACFWCIFSLFILSFPVQLFAQTQTITGTVTDFDSGEPLIGVTILVKGTTTGTTTDFNGKYKMEGISSDASLLFSFIGYNTEEVLVGNQSVIDVALMPDIKQLSEIIVVGYGTQEKKDITGAVASINNEALESRPNTNLSTLLQGQAAGVTTIPSSGKPSQGLSIRIRGISSITGSSDPLYVVDGVPTSDTRSLNPADIESISVLKDASSAAIYGAQGANGVVLITTKRGKNDKPQVQFNAYTGVATAWKTLKVLNSEQYRDLMTEMGYSTDWSQYTENTDWQNKIFQNGVSQNYQISLSGKSNNTAYYISGGYTQQEGIVRSAEMDRYNFKINLDQEVNDWMKIGTSVNYTQYHDVDVTDNTSVNSGGVILGMLTTPPNIGVFNEDGTYTSNPFQDWENPVSSTDAADRGYRNRRFLGNLYMELEFLKDFKFRSNFGVDQNNDIYDYFLDPYLTSYGRANNGIGINNTNQNSYYIIENTLSYEKTINDNKFNVLIGSVNQKNRWEYNNLETHNYASDKITTPNAGSEIIAATATKSEKYNASFLARVNYEYLDRYLLTANFRADGSSNFGPNNRWGYFPSFSVGWRLSDEGFMSGIEIINDLKIRAGWGIVGNDDIGTYAYLGQVGSGGNYPIGGTTQPGTYPSSIQNDDLKWEEGEQTNIGIDFSIWNGRINGSVEAYLKKSKDLLLSAPLPTSTGFSSAIQNVGELQNKGIDFQISSVNVDKAIHWESNLNFTINRNKVNKLVESDLYYAEINGDNAVIVTEGSPLGSFYGYVAGGVDPETGNVYYIDQDGESTFSPTTEDKKIIGDANPDFLYGFTNTISYKGISLNIFLQGSQGNDMFNATRIETEGMIDSKNQSHDVLRRWKNPGDITDIPRSDNEDNNLISTRFIEDGSYLRVKSVTLSYQFPSTILERWKLSGVRVYATGENLLTFTNYSGFDPEVNAYGGSNTALGVDYGTYPQARNFIVGLNVTF